MSELTSNSSDPLLKHEALLELAPEADRNGEEYKDPKRTRINPVRPFDFATVRQGVELAQIRGLFLSH